MAKTGNKGISKKAEGGDQVGDAYSSKKFFLEDYPRTLFPLNTNRILIEHGDDEIAKFINDKISAGSPFLPQKRVYAAKDAIHFRRTVKLDPVAEFYIYDLVYRYRAAFKKPHVEGREHYGYRFKTGRPVPASKSYTDFKSEVFIKHVITGHFIGFDVASYFNNIYHHDLVEWFAAIGAEQADVELFGRFLREANAGRSVDCLPQGLYPTKMIGNDFLRFVEESHALKSERILRFMDDFCLFDDDESNVRADFALIQRLLGQKGLSVNPGKTATSRPKTEQAENSVSDIKKELLKRRKVIVSSSLYDDEDNVEVLVAQNLSKKELDYISEVLGSGEIEEDDAELILTVMRHHTKGVEEHIPEMMRRFPHLSKNVYRFCYDVEDKEFVAKTIIDLASNAALQEYQLFWMGVMLEDYLMGTSLASNVIEVLLNHKNATEISRAKILEIPDLRFGLPDLRNGYLHSGQSDWLSWASAVGSRTMKAAARNYKLGYFMNSSEMNRLIGGIVKALP